MLCRFVGGVHGAGSAGGAKGDEVGVADLEFAAVGEVEGEGLERLGVEREFQLIHRHVAVPQ